jgi:GTP1/Obg family GTP-binding protein
MMARFLHRVTQAEYRVLQTVRAEKTRRLLIETIGQALDASEEGLKAMAEDTATLPDINSFTSVATDAILDQSKLKRFKEDLEHVDAGG